MNNAGGFITLHRQILDWEWYKDVNTFKLFLHLLLRASFADTKFLGKKIKRGQVVTSLSGLAEETGLSVQNVKTSLKHLILTNEVTNVSNKQYRIITIVKYDQYQDLTNKLTVSQQTTNKQLTNDQQYNNNINNVNKVTRKQVKKGFTPPTLDEVKSYVKEIDSQIDPEYFFDHYTTSGWRLKGGDMMKDWKAAVRNWDRRDKKNGRAGKNTGSAEKEDRGDFSFLRSTIKYV